MAVPLRPKKRRRKTFTQTRLPFGRRPSHTDALELNPVDIFNDVYSATATLQTPPVSSQDDLLHGLFEGMGFASTPSRPSVNRPFYRSFKEFKEACTDSELLHMSIQELNGIIVDMPSKDKDLVKAWRRKVKNCASAKGKPGRVQQNMADLSKIANRLIDFAEELVALSPCDRSRLVDEKLSPLSFDHLRDKVLGLVEGSKPVNR